MPKSVDTSQEPNQEEAQNKKKIPIKGILMIIVVILVLAIISLIAVSKSNQEELNTQIDQYEKDLATCSSSLAKKNAPPTRATTPSPFNAPGTIDLEYYDSDDGTYTVTAAGRPDSDYCTLEIRDDNEVYSINNEYFQSKIPCESGDFSLYIQNYIDWISDSEFIYVDEDEVVHILTADKDNIFIEELMTYPEGKSLAEVSANQEYWLYLNDDENEGFGPVTYVLEDKEGNMVKSIEIDHDDFLTTHYDKTNNGILFYWREFVDDGENTVFNTFRYLDLDTLEIEDVLVTPTVYVGGRGCSRGDIAEEKGRLFYTGDCLAVPEDMYTEEGYIVIDL